MSSKTDTHFSSWGMDGVSRRMLSQSSAHSVQVMEDGGGVARVETPGLLAHLRPSEIEKHLPSPSPSSCGGCCEIVMGFARGSIANYDL